MMQSGGISIERLISDKQSNFVVKMVELNNNKNRIVIQEFKNLNGDGRFSFGLSNFGRQHFILKKLKFYLWAKHTSNYNF